jgi:hypothetical protein
MVRKIQFKQGDLVYMDRGVSLGSPDTHIKAVYYVEADRGDKLTVHLRSSTLPMDLKVDRSHTYRNDIMRGIPGQPRLLDRFHLYTEEYEIW